MFRKQRANHRLGENISKIYMQQRTEFIKNYYHSNNKCHIEEDIWIADNAQTMPLTNLGGKYIKNTMRYHCSTRAVTEMKGTDTPGVHRFRITGTTCTWLVEM